MLVTLTTNAYNNEDTFSQFKLRIKSWRMTGCEKREKRKKLWTIAYCNRKCSSFRIFSVMRNQFKFHIYYTNFVRNCCSSLHSSIFYSRCAYQDKPLFIANGGCWAKIFSSFSFVFSETNGILLSRARYECVSFSRIIRFSVYFSLFFLHWIYGGIIHPFSESYISHIRRKHRFFFFLLEKSI